MGYKFKGAVRKYKNKFVPALILWAVLTIVFVCPLSIAIRDMQIEGRGMDSPIFFESLGKHITNPFLSLATVFSSQYIGVFWGTFWRLSLVYTFFMAVGFWKARGKNQYEDIEHGSSDWSENGEQYKILSPDKGILLADKNYLPVDKRGNVNVLVVGGSGSRKICILRYT